MHSSQPTDPPPLGASALSGLAFRHGLLLTPAIHDCGDVARLAGYSSRACSWGMRERARASLYFSSSLGKSFPARSLASGPRARHARALLGLGLFGLGLTRRKTN